MKVEFLLNNYQLGAKLRTTPKHKIVVQERVTPNHTKVVYEGLTSRELQFCEAVYGKKGVIV